MSYQAMQKDHVVFSNILMKFELKISMGGCVFFLHFHKMVLRVMRNEQGKETQKLLKLRSYLNIRDTGMRGRNVNVTEYVNVSKSFLLPIQCQQQFPIWGAVKGTVYSREQFATWGKGSLQGKLKVCFYRENSHLGP